MEISNTRMFIEYILIAFSSYLILSLIISIIGNVSYKEVLTDYTQIYASFLIYWWTPIPRMIDLSNKNY